jgi:hypothetical protein
MLYKLFKNLLNVLNWLSLLYSAGSRAASTSVPNGNVVNGGTPKSVIQFFSDSFILTDVATTTFL